MVFLHNIENTFLPLTLSPMAVVVVFCGCIVIAAARFLRFVFLLSLPLSRFLLSAPHIAIMHLQISLGFQFGSKSKWLRKQLHRARTRWSILHALTCYLHFCFLQRRIERENYCCYCSFAASAVCTGIFGAQTHTYIRIFTNLIKIRLLVVMSLWR